MTTSGRAGAETTNAPKPNEFFIISRDYDAPVHGVEFVNEERLRPAGQGLVRPDSGGFPEFPEVPFFRATLESHKLRDFYSSFEGYWLVSEKLKRVMESVDAKGVQFASTKFIQVDGSEDAKFYLCDVTRALDAVDEEASDVRILTEGFPKGKFYRLAGGVRLAFKQDVVEGVHIFRSEFNDALIVCDRKMRDALVEQGLGVMDGVTGMTLDDAAHF